MVGCLAYGASRMNMPSQIIWPLVPSRAISSCNTIPCITIDLPSSAFPLVIRPIQYGCPGRKSLSPILKVSVVGITPFLGKCFLLNVLAR